MQNEKSKKKVGNATKTENVAKILASDFFVAVAFVNFGQLLAGWLATIT